MGLWWAPVTVPTLRCRIGLQDMLADSNPMVVANAVASLAEIQEISSKDIFQVTPQSLAKLLAALNECTEWGQVFILDSIAKYMVIRPPASFPFRLVGEEQMLWESVVR